MHFEDNLHPNIILASRSDRISAFVVDQTLMMVSRFIGALMGAVVASTMVISFGSTELNIQKLGAITLFGYFFWGSVFWIINYGLLQAHFGCTIGKFLFSLRVITNEPYQKSILFYLKRTAIMQLSLAFALLGGVLYLLNKNRNGVHDMLCDTLVIDLEKLSEVVQVKPKAIHLEDFRIKSNVA